MHYSQVVEDSPHELTPPKRAASTNDLGLAAPSRQSPNPQSPKQRVLSHLTAARSALEAGDIELAENLARSAGSLGVPESQFLPDEDRPSLVAWEIERAGKRKAEFKRPPDDLPAADRGYATQLSQASAEEFPLLAPAQRDTPTTNVGSGDRLAALPEPLALAA